MHPTTRVIQEIMTQTEARLKHKQIRYSIKKYCICFTVSKLYLHVSAFQRCICLLNMMPMFVGGKKI